MIEEVLRNAIGGGARGGLGFRCGNAGRRGYHLFLGTAHRFAVIRFNDYNCRSELMNDLYRVAHKKYPTGHCAISLQRDEFLYQNFRFYW